MLLATGTLHAQETVSDYQDWALRCPEKDSCVLEQRVFMEGQEESPLIHIGFQSLERTSQLMGVFRVPLSVLLAPGLNLTIDHGTTRTIPFHHCRAQGCIALFFLSPDLRHTLEVGRKAHIGFSILDGRQIGVPISLHGITAGFKALDDTNKGTVGGSRNDHQS